MPVPAKLESLPDVLRWITDHDARQSESQATQLHQIAKLEQRQDELGTRLTTLERRVMWLCSGAALFGGLLGQALPSLPWG